MAYAVYEHGHKTIEFNTYEEACEYLDNIFDSDMWFQVESEYEIVLEETDDEFMSGMTWDDIYGI